MRGIPQFWGGRLIIKNTEFSPRPSVHLLSGREAENCSLKLTKKQMHMDPQWVVSIVIEREVPSTGEQRLTTVREFWRSKCTAGGGGGGPGWCRCFLCRPEDLRLDLQSSQEAGYCRRHLQP